MSKPLQTGATAILDGQFYVRTKVALYAIGVAGESNERDDDDERTP